MKGGQKEVHLRVVAGVEPRTVEIGDELGELGEIPEDRKIEMAALDAAAAKGFDLSVLDTIDQSKCGSGTGVVRRRLRQRAT